MLLLFLIINICPNQKECLATQSTPNPKFAPQVDVLSKLLYLLQSGKLDFVQSLMDFDPRILVKDKLGNTPLHYAAERYPEVLDSMLKKAQELGTSH